MNLKNFILCVLTLMCFVGNVPAIANLPDSIEMREHLIVSQVSSASDRGIIPGISDRMAAMPLLYRLDAQPVEELSPLLSRQYIHGSQSTFVKWTAKKEAVVPIHHHPNEQITWIVSGRAEVFSNGERYIAKEGDILFFPPNVPHEFLFLEDTIDIDFFSPARQDWIDGTENYLENE